MAKTTKQKPAQAGKTDAESVKKKTASRKVAAKKNSSKSQGARKVAASRKPAVVSKSAARKTGLKKAAPRKKVATGAVVLRHISSAKRRQMIAEVAYLRGESRGFLTDEREDWLLAEAQVDNMLISDGVVVSD
jgi:hypothetical protein